MALTESQIQRYARHILLPEVGGVGQEKLLAAEVHVRGERELVELAGDYLSAAGVRVDAHSGPGLKLELVGGPTAIVRAEDGELAVTLSPCASCAGVPLGPLGMESGAIAACLGASEVLRAILGLGEPARAWKVRGASVESVSMPACSHGAGA